VAGATERRNHAAHRAGLHIAVGAGHEERMTVESELVVPVTVAAAVYLAIFGTVAARDARRQAVGLGVIGALCAFALVYVAGLFDALRCDENCNENLVPSARTPGWQNTIHAWQWEAQWDLALAVLAAVTLATILAGVRRGRAATGAAGLAAACAVAWAVLVAS
jgi:hypothetical protein